MCKVSTSAHPFLNELGKLNVKFTIDKQNKLHLVRKIPGEIAGLLPREMIPASVLKIWREYEDGLLSKDRLGAPKYHDRIKTLRRYHLIPPVPRRSPAEKRLRSREYLRNWRKEHAVTTS